MFTGIIRAIGTVTHIKSLSGLKKYSISMPESLLLGLQRGASVAIDGVCLTTLNFNSVEATFDAIAETLNKTSLLSLKEGDLVNIERAARFGDEIGGHILSGHVFGTALIHSIIHAENHSVIFFKCSPAWTKYLLPKGYVALNGTSLTLVDIDKNQGIFSVHLIPETLKTTTFGIKKLNDLINIEIDSHIQAIVDTIENLYANKSTS